MFDGVTPSQLYTMATSGSFGTSPATLSAEETLETEKLATLDTLATETPTTATEIPATEIPATKTPTPKTPTTSDTPEELTRRLYADMVTAEFNYLRHIRQIELVNFERDTRGFVVDTDHQCYRWFFPGQKEVGSLPVEMVATAHIKKLDEVTKGYYRKLILLVHPDKCQDTSASDLFLQLQAAHDAGDSAAITNMFNYWTTHKTLQGYELMTLNQQIMQWKNEVWYQFRYGSMKNQWQEVFLSPEKLLQAQHQRREKQVEEKVRLQERIRYETEQQAKLMARLAELQKASEPSTEFQALLNRVKSVGKI